MYLDLCSYCYEPELWHAEGTQVRSRSDWQTVSLASTPILPSLCAELAGRTIVDGEGVVLLDAMLHDLVGHLAASIEEVSLGEQHAGLVAFPFESMHVGVGNQEFLQVELVYADTVQL